ncbi:glycosyltransferase [Streptomyces sp. NBC_01275]|uniref:glycosyltransferase n=1 Tax=Streptomyces sp. NBC_01275 TaxID=2903807 RepID=UPI002250C9BD|nr:glycosyltransferase [Streptomyces sp. NBC_01275]MCX4763829.1 glycosyltransferase [Streptomyces sp. NBC_01275]
MTDHPLVTVFTMTYNQRDKILALADDLAAQDWPAARLHFTVLDDGGSDGTADALEEAARKLPYRIDVLRRVHEADYLSAQRWNECIAASHPETDVFVQVDDVRLRPDFLQRHAAWHGEAGLALVTGSKFEGDEPTWDLETCRRAHLAAADGQARETDLWTAFWGASLSYSRELVSLLSTDEHDRPFDSRMTGWGFHEVEFACRAAQAGARLVYDPAVGVFHQNHTPVNDRGRGIDHARQKDAGAAKNEQYLLTKHGLDALPRW